MTCILYKPSIGALSVPTALKCPDQPDPRPAPTQPLPKCPGTLLWDCNCGQGNCLACAVVTLGSWIILLRGTAHISLVADTGSPKHNSSSWEG